MCVALCNESPWGCFKILHHSLKECKALIYYSWFLDHNPGTVDEKPAATVLVGKELCALSKFVNVLGNAPVAATVFLVALVHDFNRVAQADQRFHLGKLDRGLTARAFPVKGFVQL